MENNFAWLEAGEVFLVLVGVQNEWEGVGQEYESNLRLTFEVLFLHIS